MTQKIAYIALTLQTINVKTYRVTCTENLDPDLLGSLDGCERMQIIAFDSC